MPDPTPSRDKDAPHIQEPRKPRPPWWWCSECWADGPPHEPGCPLVREMVNGLATALAVDATIEAMKKEKR